MHFIAQNSKGRASTQHLFLVGAHFTPSGEDIEPNLNPVWKTHTKNEHKIICLFALTKGNSSARMRRASISESTPCLRCIQMNCFLGNISTYFAVFHRQINYTPFRTTKGKTLGIASTVFFFFYSQLEFSLFCILTE